jgi:hypothetical protein
MRLISALCVAGSLIAPALAGATPFPPGGQYVMGPSASIDFQQTFGPDTYFLQYLSVVLNYGTAVVSDLDSDMLVDDYTVPFSMVGTSCFSINSVLQGCGAFSFADTPNSTVIGTGTGPGTESTQITSMSMIGFDVLSPPAAFLQASPTLTSLGLAGPATSFFDIFFEAAPNGPNNGWLAQLDGPSHFTLQDIPASVPEPTSLMLFGTGVLGIATAVRRRRTLRTDKA